MLSRLDVLDSAASPAAVSGRNLFYSTLFHALRKPTDFTGQVPDSWTTAAEPGYIFDLGTMWDQYKTTLPLVLSLYPEMGTSMLQGLLNLKRRCVPPTLYARQQCFLMQCTWMLHMHRACSQYARHPASHLRRCGRCSAVQTKTSADTGRRRRTQ